MVDEKTARCHKLRELMRAHRLSVADISELLAVNLSHVRGMKAGLKPVTRKTLRLLELEIAERKRAVQITNLSAV